ncbi:MAG: C-GCAxxG-C-C family (seleno)protein [Bacillota bacterium]|nr:C-GCAxxG-C-C family (seleno)protein [Bacillota bacterium]
MLKERIRIQYEAGESCSRIILRAAAEEYGFSLSEDILSACSGISGGFGIGGMCSALVAAVMVLGLLYDGEETAGKRILFLYQMQERFGHLDCSRLSAMEEDCLPVLEEIGEILEAVIEG